ncbi:MAG: hypothetical protein HW398_1148 [Acidobacteria bacterium]|nr:hypothetical protein [Acidobacteriota bacterium]
MTSETKPVEALQVADLQSNAIWQYVNDDARGETVVRPIKRSQVRSLTGKLVGTQVQLANGDLAWALIGNIDVENPRLTRHFLTLSVERNGKWFALARHHDFDYSTRGPNALAKFLGLEVNQVFPISYDITLYSAGDRAVLSGQIPRQPREKLSRAQIIALAVPRPRT